jgi:haloalkane dehalogenase
MSGRGIRERLAFPDLLRPGSPPKNGMLRAPVDFICYSQVPMPTTPISNPTNAAGQSIDSREASMGWRALYPFQPKRFRLDGVEMSYVDEGAGEPVLMVHGNPTWSFYWRGLIKRLCGQHRTIAVDHIGCGLSDKPADYAYCLAQHRDNLVKLVDGLELHNITLVAHDWGGAIGLAALLERQEKFKRIVLYNTGAFPPPYIPLRIRACRWPIVGKIGVQGFNMFARAATTMATEQPGGLPGPVAAGMLAPYDNWTNRSAIYGFVKDIPATPSHETWSVLQKIETRLPELRELPVLLVWGMKDWCFRPECLDRFCQHWPHAEVHRIASAGHFVVEDAATEVEATTAEFLSRS